MPDISLQFIIDNNLHYFEDFEKRGLQEGGGGAYFELKVILCGLSGGLIALELTKKIKIGTAKLSLSLNDILHALSSGHPSSYGA